MNKVNELYSLEDGSEREKKLWEEAIFVFDTSFLLELYSISKKERKNIYDEIFNKAKNRLWIPAHVEYEYLKNRDSIITKPIKDKLEPLKLNVKKIKTDIINSLDKSLSDINKLIKDTKNEDKHTYLEEKHLKSYKSHVNDLKNNEIFNQIEKIEKDILKEVNFTKKEIKENDDVYEAIEKYFEVGKEYTFNQLMEITKEGKHRYEYKIPPGYGDLKNKKGTQIFGDLIIWKQILEYSKEKKKPIVFLTNDIVKDDDWCYIDKRGRVIAPRDELIKEIYDNSKVEFWIYTQETFLYKAKKYLDSAIDTDTVDTFRQISDAIVMLRLTKDYFIANENILIDYGINMILNSADIYTKSLNNKIKNFKNVIKNDFNLMILYCDELNDNIFENRIILDNIDSRIYCDFYNYLVVYIKNENLHQRVIENLTDIFDFFASKHCS